jgi:hypothetical protein
MKTKTHRLPAVLAVALWGCSSGPIPVDDLEEKGALDVRLDASSRAQLPGKQIKFWVEITNRSPHTLDLADLRVELQAVQVAEREKICLRQDWTYRWNQEIRLLPGKRLTVPIVPEKGVEFPLEILREGKYEIVAVVNERHASRPWPLQISRPDLIEPPRRT